MNNYNINTKKIRKDKLEMKKSKSELDNVDSILLSPILKQHQQPTELDGSNNFHCHSDRSMMMEYSRKRQPGSSKTFFGNYKGSRNQPPVSVQEALARALEIVSSMDSAK